MNFCSFDSGAFNEAGQTASSFTTPFSSQFISPLASQASFMPEMQLCEATGSYDAVSTHASSDSHRSSMVGAARPVNQNCNLYVASLPPSCTDADLFALFSPFGPIVSAKAMCKKGVKECKGYGFVLFQSEEDAQRAQNSMIGHMIGNNKIQVRRSRATACTPLIENRGSTFKVEAEDSAHSRPAGALHGLMASPSPPVYLQSMPYPPHTLGVPVVYPAERASPLCLNLSATQAQAAAAQGQVVYMMMPSQRLFDTR